MKHNIIKTVILLTFFIFVITDTYGQTVYQKIIKYCDRDSSSTSCCGSYTGYDDGAGHFFINKKQVTKKVYDNIIKKESESIELKCHAPYILITLDIDGDTISKALKESFFNYCGLFIEYYKNGKIKTKGNYYNYSRQERDEFTNRNYDMPLNVKDGEWLYYNDGGILIKKETYKKGVLIE